MLRVLDTRPLTVSARAARNHWGQILDRAERGEIIVITRRGAPVARLVPFRELIDHGKVQRAIDDIFALQKDQTLGGLSIEEIIREGSTGPAT